jgi:hypothetical protein
MGITWTPAGETTVEEMNHGTWEGDHAPDRPAADNSSAALRSFESSTRVGARVMGSYMARDAMQRPEPAAPPGESRARQGALPFPRRAVGRAENGSRPKPHRGGAAASLARLSGWPVHQMRLFTGVPASLTVGAVSPFGPRVRC